MTVMEDLEYGPDRIIQTNNICSWDADGAVKIRMSDIDNADGDTKPVSTVTMFDEVCARGGDHLYMKVFRDEKWVEWSYKDVHRDVKCAARAFIKLGLQPHHTVAITGFNSPEWVIANIAAIYAGGMATGLYPTNSAAINHNQLLDSNTNILVAESASMLPRMWEDRDQLGHLKKVIFWSGKIPEGPDYLSWEEMMKVGGGKGKAAQNGVSSGGGGDGGGNPDEEWLEELLEERHRKMAVNQGCTLIYTSGTTGNPKGVMLSHDNIIWSARTANKLVGMKDRQEVVVSYLPLSHIAANMCDIWAIMYCCGTVVFADKMALKGTLLKSIQEARPTVFVGVPRVWEKIMEGMKAKARTIGGAKKIIGTVCKQAGLDHHLHHKNSPMYKLGKKIYYCKVKEALGLDRCHAFLTGAAPTSMQVLKYFLSLDIQLWNLYGLSETTGCLSFSSNGKCKLGRAGQVVPNGRVLIQNPDEDGNGEICYRSRSVMMGYLNREDQTTKDIDPDGYLHTGDVGIVDEEGFIKITGRIKELLITAGGENVAPVPIEDNIKEALPCISNAVVIGDCKKFLSVFLTFKVVIDGNNVPTDNLTQESIDWCASVGSRSTKVSEILKGPDFQVMQAIQTGLDEANNRAVSRATMIQKWTILPRDVSEPGGELGPTLKLIRKAFNNKYSDAIDKFYD